jgi:hypothetical protein
MKYFLLILGILFSVISQAQQQTMTGKRIASQSVGADSANFQTPIVNGAYFYYDNIQEKWRIWQNGQLYDLLRFTLPSTVSDGDKGDITVSGGLWDIDNNVINTSNINNSQVTFAKFQNINTQTVLGRGSASTGLVEQLSLGNGLSWNGTSFRAGSTLIDDLVFDGDFGTWGAQFNFMPLFYVGLEGGLFHVESSDGDNFKVGAGQIIGDAQDFSLALSNSFDVNFGLETIQNFGASSDGWVYTSGRGYDFNKQSGRSRFQIEVDGDIVASINDGVAGATGLEEFKIVRDGVNRILVDGANTYVNGSASAGDRLEVSDFDDVEVNAGNVLLTAQGGTSSLSLDNTLAVTAEDAYFNIDEFRLEQSGVGIGPPELLFQEEAANGSDYISFFPGNLVQTTLYTLPTDYPASNGYVLSSTTAGVMSWVAQSGGGGGITNGAANNELMKSDGTNAVGSGIFINSGSTIIDLGSTSISGSRTFRAVSSSGTSQILFASKGGTFQFYDDAAGNTNTINIGPLGDQMVIERDETTGDKIRGSAGSNPFIIGTVAVTAGNGDGIRIDGGDGFPSGDTNGGDAALNAGNNNGSGTPGSAILSVNEVAKLTASNTGISITVPFTGTPAAPTATTGTNTTQIATTAFVQQEITARAPKVFIVAASDENTVLTTGTAKIKFRMPYAMTLTEVRASLNVAQASGSIITIDLNENGTSVLSTKVTIDNTEKTSTTSATPSVISDSALADDAEMSIDIDQVDASTIAAGLKFTLKGN